MLAIVSSLVIVCNRGNKKLFLQLQVADQHLSRSKNNLNYEP